MPTSCRGRRPPIPRRFGTSSRRDAATLAFMLWPDGENTTISTWHEISAVDEGAKSVPDRPRVRGQYATTCSTTKRRPSNRLGRWESCWLGGEGCADLESESPELSAERFVAHPTLGPTRRHGDLATYGRQGTSSSPGVSMAGQSRGHGSELDGVNSAGTLVILHDSAVVVRGEHGRPAGNRVRGPAHHTADDSALRLGLEALIPPGLPCPLAS